MDFENCDPEVFEAAYELLEQRAREQERERLRQELNGRLGR